jgi:hypothetical protein
MDIDEIYRLAYESGGRVETEETPARFKGDEYKRVVKRYADDMTITWFILSFTILTILTAGIYAGINRSVNLDVFAHYDYWLLIFSMASMVSMAMRHFALTSRMTELTKRGMKVTALYDKPPEEEEPLRKVKLNSARQQTELVIERQGVKLIDDKGKAHHFKAERLNQLERQRLTRKEQGMDDNGGAYNEMCAVLKYKKLIEDYQRGYRWTEKGEAWRLTAGYPPAPEDID